ncbi:MAG: DUF2203 family protein [Myxococcota bacterium]
MAERRWTLEAARELLPDVRTRTARAVAEVQALDDERALHDAGSRERGALEQRIQEIVTHWEREMEALGADVKGLWLVDFDSGSGYYCWQWPEERLEYYHSYEAGFAGRGRIH